ncbi:MAG: hypothetical protein COC11_04280 [Candidatus Neomarinimicrobiota bacterium]|jgi:hypothetical protein|nr:MAG: hypothetical protein COC11_04280 [Candidatus Neomarinimicrobiota bacterium]
MSCSTTEMKALSVAAYAVAVGGADLDGIAHALRTGYDKGRGEYLDQHPEVRATIMATPEPLEEDFCSECGMNLNGPSFQQVLYRAASAHATAEHDTN